MKSNEEQCQQWRRERLAKERMKREFVCWKMCV